MADSIVQDFKSRELAPPRQYRLAAITVLLATLAVAALAVLVVRENQNAERLKTAYVELERAKSERDVYFRKYAQQIQRDIARSTAAESAADQARAREDAQLLASELANVAASPSAQGQYRAPSAALTRDVQLLTLGAPRGWDVDVFWCAGQGAETNYGQARMTALALASAATTRQAVAPGTRIGRVRLRPVREQDRGAWPEGVSVVRDLDPNEEQAANAVATYLGGRTRIEYRRVQNINRNAQTGFYLSIFHCRR